MAGKSKGRSKRPHTATTAFVTKRQWQQGFSNAQPDFFNTSQNTPPLTMAQEARNTERHTISRSNVQLRHQQVAFISAGSMKRDADQDDAALETVNQSLKELTTSKSTAETQGSPSHSSNVVEEPEATPASDLQSHPSKSHIQVPENPFFFIDSTGDKTKADVDHAQPIVRPRSPTPTDSSEDEVVFVGRNKSKARPPVDEWTQHFTDLPSRSLNHGEDKSPMENTENTPPTQSSEEYPAPHEDSEISISLKPKSNRRRGRERALRQRKQEIDDEDLILADYIANMKNDDDSESETPETSLRPRPSSETDGVKYGRAVSVSRKQVRGDNTRRSISWSSNDFDDLGDLSTSDEIPSEIGRIFSKRQRRLGVQYLVTGKGQIPDEARWILKERLTMTGADEQIKAFEDEQPSFPLSSEDSDSTSISEKLDYMLGDVDSEDEGFVAGGRQGGMSDEQIARLLQRQETLGLAAGDFDEEDDSDDIDAIATRNPTSQTKFISRKSKKNRKGQFPSATAFADALDQDPYHAFDVMDFDRPSLKKKQKGRRNDFDFELSDSDMEWDLQQVWENDRTKKKAKKIAREELRAQRLLSGKHSKLGMKGAMSSDDVKEKIKAFLLSSSESLSLPPMDKRDRKLVHNLANLVSIKSQSRGSGMTRFPMLYKTARTPQYNGKSITDVDRVFSSGRSMRRLGRRGQEGGAGKATKPRRAGGNAAASYMDGDVVGASAPEIGIGNRGRAMLEKMGWSTGTALGATDNKGILQPLAHVVKNSKAGLG